ncbi:MAG TPA: AAA family ATPase [Clostridiales bacterium]|nr:AAA family ATPase [Clostridiales bacterium]
MKNTGALPRYLNDPSYYKSKDFLFLDISGFTPLCDKFIRESSYGAEKIGDLVNAVFNPIIDFVYETGGDVISFAGDALFISAEKKEIKSIERKCGEIIRSQSIDRNLSIRIERFEGKYYPQIMNTNRSSLYCYSKNLRANEELKYVPFPKEIFEIYRSSFSGELRAVPVFFIHIGEEYGIDDLKPLLEFLSDSAKEHSVYVNKIEYLDKGWMILLSAGSPVYAADAPVKMHGLLAKFIKKAKKLNIPVRTGGTLQRGYCGIIGNEKRWEFTFLGSNVNLAARIAAGAEPGRIFCDSSFALASKTVLESVPVGKREYKGVGVKEIFEIKGTVRNSSGVFVGREQEIRSCLNFFAGDRRAFVLLSGPSGIGKTVLAENIISSLGYKNLIRLKGIYGSDEPEHIFKNSDFFRDMNSAEIFKKFRSVTEPALIYIDDLHFADGKSLFTFHRMLNEGCPFVNIIATCISEERIKITALSYYEPLVVKLQPFGAKEIQEVTKKVSGIDISLKASRELMKTTKGNPLFITGILPYITKDLKNSSEIPYTLQEVILLKLNSIPGKGPDFVDGGSVYGDIFDGGVMKDVISLADKVLRSIVSRAETEGLIRKSAADGEMEFSNTIIREIVYEKLLKKKIYFFRKRIAEAIFSSGTKDLRKLYKAFTMLYLSEDDQTVKAALKIIKIHRASKNRELIRNIYEKSFSHMKEKNDYSCALELTERFISARQISMGSELISLVEDAALNINDWKGGERQLLNIARRIFFTRFCVPSEVMKRYSELKGEDIYYRWTRARTYAYEEDTGKVRDTFYGLRKSFNGKERIEFFIDFVWYAFFILGDREMEEEGLEELKKYGRSFPEELKVNYMLLLNTIAMHRDDMKASSEILDAIEKIKELPPDSMFNILNDRAIVCSNLAYERSDPVYMKKALKYSEKAVKCLKDFQKISDLPLAVTNLASFYGTAGLYRRASRTYLEGLYYGLEIDHPVEVPYTKSRIMFIALNSGAFRLALNIAEEVICCDVGDIKSAPFAVRYHYGQGKRTDLKKAYEYADEYVKFGTGKCWWETLGVVFSKAVNGNDAELMKEVRKKLMELSHLPQRQGMRFGNEANISVLGCLIGIKGEDFKVSKILKDMEKMKFNFGLQSRCAYALGMFRKDSELLKKSRKLAVRSASYPFVHRIETELFRMTGNKYWKNRLKITSLRLNEMNKADTIEDLLVPGNKK